MVLIILEEEEEEVEKARYTYLDFIVTEYVLEGVLLRVQVHKALIFPRGMSVPKTIETRYWDDSECAGKTSFTKTTQVITSLHLFSS